MAARFDFTFGPENNGRERNDAAAQTLRIAMLGDFRGRQQRGEAAPESLAQRCRFVDIDSVENVLAEWIPRATVATEKNEQAPVTVSFRDMDDFHPDALRQAVPMFAELDTLEKKLRDPKTFAEAAAELALDSETETDPDHETPSTQAGAQSLDDLLQRPVKSGGERKPHVRGHSAVDKLLRDAVGATAVPAQDPKLEECIEQVNAARQKAMRTLLHHPHFQELESLWRTVDMLLRRLPPEDAALQLIDITRDELQQVLSGDPPGKTWLDECLESTGATPAAMKPCRLLTCMVSFGSGDNDLQCLHALAQFASRNQLSVATGGRPSLVGTERAADLLNPETWAMRSEESAQWATLRRAAGADRLAVAMPRFLVRLPYGDRDDPVATFDFEEMTRDADHAHFLWGNAAALLTLALAHQVSEDIPTSASGAWEVDDLPVHVVHREGQSDALPCAEVWLTDRTLEKLLDLGISPVQSIRGRDAVHLVPVSLAGSLWGLG